MGAGKKIGTDDEERGDINFKHEMQSLQHVIQDEYGRNINLS